MRAASAARSSGSRRSKPGGSDAGEPAGAGIGRGLAAFAVEPDDPTKEGGLYISVHFNHFLPRCANRSVGRSRPAIRAVRRCAAAPRMPPTVGALRSSDKFSALSGLPETDRTLLIVDDDAPLCQRLVRAMERRGFVVATADSVAEGVAAATGRPPAFAVVDMRLGDGRGFEIVGALRQARPSARIVMLTGYGNIATAVAAVKAGAVDYLPKPADADAVERALLAREDGVPEPPEDPMSADRVRWEHIQRVFELCERNVSETARRLKMHRRTLQRILGKHAPRG